MRFRENKHAVSAEVKYMIMHEKLLENFQINLVFRGEKIPHKMCVYFKISGI